MSIFSFLLVEKFFIMIIQEINLYLVYILISFTLIWFFLNFMRTKPKKNNLIILIEIISLFFCFFYFQPLISFFLYFCFLHSIRHLINEKKELKLTNFQLLKGTIPMTLLTIIFFLFIYMMYFLGFFDSQNINLLIIGLTSLTISHILLVNFSE